MLFLTSSPCLLRTLIFSFLLLNASASADVVKPALIEINAHKQGEIKLEIRASIEALLTGINSQYRNTQSAPTADDYDALRILPSADLQTEFNDFSATFSESIALFAHSKKGKTPIALAVDSVLIPEPGYTKVPRISTLILSGQLPSKTTALSFRYPVRFSDYAVRVRQVDEQAQKWHWSSWEWIKSDKESQAFSLSEIITKKTAFDTLAEFIPIGFLHILPRGLDHILFILGLFLFSRKLRPLFWQITMFTLAHTVTLGLASAGYIELPARITEPLIALSIAYIGFENVWIKKLHKHRLSLVFAFGLLHGLGFASVLNDFDLDQNGFVISLISFNIGVELGQLAILLGAWLILKSWMSSINYRRFIVVPFSFIIGMVGVFWTFERLNLL